MERKHNTQKALFTNNAELNNETLHMHDEGGGCRSSKGVTERTLGAGWGREKRLVTTVFFQDFIWRLQWHRVTSGTTPIALTFADEDVLWVSKLF